MARMRQLDHLAQRVTSYMFGCFAEDARCCESVHAEEITTISGPRFLSRIMPNVMFLCNREYSVQNMFSSIIITSCKSDMQSMDGAYLRNCVFM